MFNANFNYDGRKLTIQCNKGEKIKEIYKKFLAKVEVDNKNLYLLYNGNIIREDLSIEDIANEIDKSNKNIEIVVAQTNNTIIKDKFVKSNEIICLKCNENILAKIEDFRITLYDCKNGRI